MLMLPLYRLVRGVWLGGRSRPCRSLLPSGPGSPSAVGVEYGLEASGRGWDSPTATTSGLPSRPHYGRSRDFCLRSAQGGYICTYRWPTHSYATEVVFVHKTTQSAVFVSRRQQDFVNMTCAWKRAFPGVCGNFWGYWTPAKRGVLVIKNSLASCQRCRHSVEPRQ